MRHHRRAAAWRDLPALEQLRDLFGIERGVLVPVGRLELGLEPEVRPHVDGPDHE